MTIKHDLKRLDSQIVGRRHTGYAIVSSLIEILLIGVLVWAVTLSVPLLLQSSGSVSAEKPPKRSDPIFRLGTTANDRLLIQVGYTEIASVNLLTHENQSVFRSQRSPVVCSRFARDDATFMVSIEDREIGIFKQRELLIWQPIPAGTTVDISLSSSGQTALLVLEETRIRCWDLSGPNPTWSDYEIPEPVARITLTPNGEMFATSTSQGVIDLYESKTGIRVESLSDAGSVKSDLVFSDDGQWLAFAGSQAVYLYDMHSFKMVWQVRLPASDDQQHVAISHDGQLVAVGSCRSGIEILSGHSGETLHRFTLDKSPRSMDFSRSGDELYTTHVGEGLIRIWCLSTGRGLNPIKVF